MAVVVFRPRAQRAVHRWRAVLVKNGRERLYAIQPAGQPGVMQTWVRFDGKPHRAKLTSSVVELAQIRQEYQREITALLEDGWTRQNDS